MKTSSDLNNKRVLVVLRGHIGDCIMGTPCFRIIKENYPEARVTAMINEYAKRVLRNNPYVDDILFGFRYHPRSGFAGRIEKILHLGRLFLGMRKFDAIILLRYSPPGMVALAQRAGIPVRIGYQAGKYTGLLTVNAGEEDMDISCRLRNARVLEAAGMKLDDLRPEVYVTEGDRDSLKKKLKAKGIEDNETLIGFHPGCHWDFNEWKNERWIEVLKSLAEKKKARIVMTGAEDEDAEKATIFKEALGDRFVSLVKDTTVGELFAVYQRVAFGLGVDSAVTQIELALGTPAVVLFGTDLTHWNGPLGEEPMIAIREWKGPAEGERDPEEHDANAGKKGSHDRGGWKSGLDDITVEQVLTAVEELPGRRQED